MNKTPIPFLGPEIYEGITERGLSEDLFGWNSHHPIFVELIAERSPQVIIEVGTWKGASAIHMANLTRHLSTKIYCVDTWIGGDGHIFTDVEDTQPVMRDEHGWAGVYYQFLHNVAWSGHQKRIVPVPFMSLHAAILFEAHGIKADLIYIDGGHQPLDVCMDLTAYIPLLADGGIIFGDDYNYPSVKGVVDDFMASLSELYYLTTAGEKWAIKPIKA